jgi:hypothetical protein
MPRYFIGHLGSVHVKILLPCAVYNEQDCVDPSPAIGRQERYLAYLAAGKTKDPLEVTSDFPGQLCPSIMRLIRRGQQRRRMSAVIRVGVESIYTMTPNEIKLSHR